MVVNKIRGTLQISSVKAPGFGDRRKAMLVDIATLTGGEFISEDLGIKLENIDISKTRSRKKSSYRQRQHHDHRRCWRQKKLSKLAFSQFARKSRETSSDYDREKLQERLAKLVGGVAVINVGAATETEMKEKKSSR